MKDYRLPLLIVAGLVVVRSLWLVCEFFAEMLDG